MVKLFHITDKLAAWQNSRQPRSDEPGGVLLLSSGGLGDTILFSHVIDRFVGLAEPGETVSVLMRQDGSKTAFLFPENIITQAVDFTRLRKDNVYRRKTMTDLFEANYRLVISTDYLRHPDLDEALMLACQAPETAVMRARPWQKYQNKLDRNESRFTRKFDSGPQLRDKVLRWADFADWLKGETSPPPLARISDERLGDLEAHDEGKEVLVQPFSAVKAKQSPPSLYEALVDRLPVGTRVVITGTPDDLEKNPEFKPLLEREGVEFDGARFIDIQARIRGSRLVISVDTAMMHLAIALGAPTLGLASAAYVGEIVPYAAEITPDNAYFYYVPMDCQGCLGNCIHPAQKNMYPCVAKLDPDKVIEMALDIMNSENIQ